METKLFLHKWNLQFDVRFKSTGKVTHQEARQKSVLGSSTMPLIWRSNFEVST